MVRKPASQAGNAGFKSRTEYQNNKLAINN